MRLDQTLFIAFRQADAIAGDHALALQPFDPGLHGRSRQAEPAGNRGGRHAGVFAEYGEKLAILVGDLHFVGPYGQSAEYLQAI
ncbi:hypothetical protein D3C86_1905260 [compost metagenome]